MISVRAVPRPKSWRSPGGTCRWCGKKIRHATTRKVLLHRNWHHECSTDYLACRSPQQAPVAAKSNDRCAGCGAQLWHFAHAGPVIDPAPFLESPYSRIHQLYGYLPPGGRRCTGPRDVLQLMGGLFSVVSFERLWLRDFTAPPAANGHQPSGWVRPGGAYSPVDACWTNFQIDHIVPLWSLDRTLAWSKLIAYWRIGNLQALCDRCHKRKTAREATDRHARKRTAGQETMAL